MTIIIDKNMSKEEFKSLLNKSKSKKKGVSVKTFTGKLRWKGDALKVQRSQRDEQ
ncbi:MAG: hypothetical protein HY015_04045 [Bacteroidetes bacterium]|nr:hypothetical protein [Bacteroidota bacterium]MBI3482134.1 hypothetical protein [Bacteroidota bacterium]